MTVSWGSEVSTALRILVSLGVLAVALAVLLGPRWRGSFYRSWLRPRLVAFAVLLVLFTSGLYLYRVFNALQGH